MNALTRGLRTLTLAALVVMAGALAAQAQKLPQLPNAPEKATSGGTTQAAASLESGGGSALEPYLVTWLLPVSGIITLIVAVIADRSVRRAHGAGSGR